MGKTKGFQKRLILGDSPGGNYVDSVSKLPLKPNSVTHVTVVHDDDCAIFTDSPCSCEPELMADVWQG